MPGTPVTAQDIRSAFSPAFWLQLGTTVVLVTLAYAAVSSQGQNNADDIGALAKIVEGVVSDVNTLKVDGARTDERYSQLLALMSRIDTRLERLEQRGAP